MKRFLRKWIAGTFVLLLGVWPQQVQPASAASVPPVAQISLIGQDGQAGTVFGWLDQSYTSNVNATITNRTLKFWGSQSWIGYDRNGNQITGSTSVQSFSLDTAPVQIITPGTYSYQVTETDSTGASVTSFTQSFSVSTPSAQTSVATVSSTGVDGVSANVGFSVSTAGSRSVNSNGGSLLVNANAPFTVYDATSGNVQTEDWTMGSGGSWSGTNATGPLSSAGTWTYSRNSGVHWVAPYTYTRQTGGGYYRQVIVGYQARCQGPGGEHPPLHYDHPGGCFNAGSTAYSVPIYGQQYVPPVYTTYHGGNYWAYGSWPNPDGNMVNSIATVASYNLTETDGKVTYGVNLQVDPYRGGISGFNLKNSVVGTTHKLSGLGVTTTGDLTGTTETWYVISPQGTQTYSSLSALNNASFTVTADMGATIAHVVKINNQTYVSYQAFIVKHAAFVLTSTGGVVNVTQILYPSSGQAFPTDQLPVQVKAGGEVTYQIQTIGNVASVTVTYSDGQTQSLQQGSPGVWGGYYYPSQSQTIPVTTPSGTSISIQNIKATTSDGVVLTQTSSLLVVTSTNSSNGGTTYPPRIIE